MQKSNNGFYSTSVYVFSKSRDKGYVYSEVKQLLRHIKHKQQSVKHFHDNHAWLSLTPRTKFVSKHHSLLVFALTKRYFINFLPNHTLLGKFSFLTYVS